VRRHLARGGSALHGLEWPLNEIADNVLQHAEAPEGGLAAVTVAAKRRRAQFVVADAGRGIPATMCTVKGSTDGRSHLAPRPDRRSHELTDDERAQLATWTRRRTSAQARRRGLSTPADLEEDWIAAAEHCDAHGERLAHAASAMLDRAGRR
jgi:hypothetical protein